MAKFDTAVKGSAEPFINNEKSRHYSIPTGQKYLVWNLSGEVNKSLMREVHEMKYSCIIIIEFRVFNRSDYRHS
jgi:hypothetical protein